MGKAANSGGEQRRHDLDWLRIIAFGLLIFYHVGMLYSSSGWHVKSQYASTAPDGIMNLVNPWRLALLFFISGVATRYASDQTESRLRFAWSRVIRLGSPILFGLTLLVMPQAYFEFRQAGVIEPGLAEFYPAYLSLEQSFPSPTPTWNHLWYLVYLLTYVLLILPLLPWLRTISISRPMAWVVGGPARLLLVVLVPFVAYELWLSPKFPTTHALVNDWAHHAHRLTIFLLGYLVAKHKDFWRNVHKSGFAAGILMISLAPLRLYSSAIRTIAEQTLPEALTSPVLIAASILYAWSSIIVLLALAQQFLNRPSPLLRHLTAGVFCYYVVHQTITVAAGYYLTQLDLGVLLEFCAVSAITLTGCVVSFEAFRRVPILRLFLGIQIKLQRRSSNKRR